MYNVKNCRLKYRRIDVSAVADDDVDDDNDKDDDDACVVGGGLLDPVLWHPARRPRRIPVVKAPHHSQVDVSQAEVPHQLQGGLRRPRTQEGLPSAQPHRKCRDFTHVIVRCPFNC